ncbi:YggT family protein [Orbaceae bacterium ac157xtp]
MTSLFYLINSALNIYLYILILRLWMHYKQVNYYNPITQFVVKVTQPLVSPLRKILPVIRRIDTATCLLIYLVALIKFIYMISNLPIDLPTFNYSYLLYTFYLIIYTLGHLIFWLLLARAILSWISRGYSALEEVLAQLTEPLIYPIRRIIPPIGGLDLSFMVFVFILILLNGFAAQVLNPWWFFFSQI